MSPDEVRAFSPPQPHVMPVWFVLDGDGVLFTTHVDTVKAKWIRKDGRVSLCVDEEVAPYVGEDRAEEFGRRNAVAGELLVPLAPERVIAQSGVAD